MKTLLFSLSVALLAGSAARADIDLTPTQGVRELEGCRFPQLEFREGKRTITYEPPKGWDYFSGDQHALMLRVKDKVQADAKIEVVPSAEKLTFDPEQLKLMEAQFAAALPKNSEHVELDEAVVNAILINGHATCELAGSFVLHGQRYKVSTLYVDLDAAQLRFSLSCTKSDFEALHKAFVGSWYSWQWL